MKKIILSSFVSVFISLYGFSYTRVPYIIQKGTAICDTIYTEPDKKAEFPGGTAAMFDFFHTNLFYSANLVNGISSQRLLIKILIDRQGRIVNKKVLISLSSKYDEDALKVVSMFPEFIPAKVNGHNVCSYIIIPLCYR